MNKESGLGVVGIFFIIILIIMIISGAYYVTKKFIKNEENADIKANMLLIQGACKVLRQNSIVKKDDSILIGNKMSEMTEDSIINEFKAKNIIDESNYDKYFVLSNEDLKNLNIEVQNEKDSYYIVNYNDNEVYITKGYDGKYKLSEMM